VTLRTAFRGACAALLFSTLPMALATATPAAAETPEPVQAIAMPAAAVFGGSSIYPSHGRYLLVDAASARLFMVEDGEVRDSMRVIVGKATSQTPTIASKIYYATLNPYWNVPADLARTLIAPRVLEQGVRYLREHNYQVLAGFDDDAPVISPEDVDWNAVAAGRTTVKVRQLPGPANSMGQVKFGFPNNDGIFLHDTPKKELFASDERAISHGCVRLEDAPRLARWLLGRDPGDFGSIPEEQVPLPQAVPIYITYLNEPAIMQPVEPALTFASASR
jgi:murein L,D-transpeptidase YcbB/YkuD